MNFATLLCMSAPAVIIYKNLSLSVNVVKFGYDRIIDVYKESLSALYFAHVIIKWYSSSVWCPEHVLHTLSLSLFVISLVPRACSLYSLHTLSNMITLRCGGCDYILSHTPW